MAILNKITLSIALCMMTTIPQVAAYADTPDISGTYTCTGSDPTSTPNAYTDDMVIKKNGDIYNIRYLQTGSVTPYLLGTGIVNKDVNNVMSLIFWDPTTLAGATETYVVKPDGSLDGLFASSKKQVAGNEICKKKS